MQCCGSGVQMLTSLPALQATAQLDLKRKELTSHLQKMGVGLGKSLVTRTTDLFDQVCSSSVQ